jgi:hypothetical protein
MIIILFLCNVLLEVVIRYDKVSVKKLGNRVIASGSSGKDLGVVDVKARVDEIDITIDGSGINW